MSWWLIIFCKVFLSALLNVFAKSIKLMNEKFQCEWCINKINYELQSSIWCIQLTIRRVVFRFCNISWFRHFLLSVFVSDLPLCTLQMITFIAWLVLKLSAGPSTGKMKFVLFCRYGCTSKCLENNRSLQQLRFYVITATYLKCKLSIQWKVTEDNLFTEYFDFADSSMNSSAV